MEEEEGPLREKPGSREHLNLELDHQCLKEETEGRSEEKTLRKFHNASSGHTLVFDPRKKPSSSAPRSRMASAIMHDRQIWSRGEQGITTLYIPLSPSRCTDARRRANIKNQERCAGRLRSHGGDVRSPSFFFTDAAARTAVADSGAINHG